MDKGFLSIEVVYALPKVQHRISLTLPPKSTVKEAIEASQIQERCPEIDLMTMTVGIYGQKVGLEQVLETGDRVEIYRPVTVDPKEARKRRK